MSLIKYIFKLEFRRQLLLMFLVAAGVVLGFVNIAIEGRIIDDAIGGGTGTGDISLLFRYVIIYFTIIIITSSLSYFNDILFNETTQRILIRLRKDLFDRVLRLDQSFFAKTPMGEVISRIVTEVQQLGGFLSKIVLVPMSCLITIIAGFGLIAGIDIRLAGISLGIYFLVFIFLPPLRRQIRGLSKQWGRGMRCINHRAEESISHYGQVQSHNTFAFEESRFSNSLWDFFHIQMKMARTYGVSGMLSGFFSELANLTVYGVGGYLIIRASGMGGTLTVGALFIMIRVLGNIIKPINTLIDFYQRLGEAQVKFDMVSDYLNIPPAIADGPQSRDMEDVRGSIVLEDVTFGFSGEEKIIRGISLTIPPGQKTALVGPAGCGKSTLALLINGLIKPTSGKIAIDGVEISNISQKSLRRLAGYVPQAKTGSPVLFGGTLGDNILYGLKERQENPDHKPEGWLDLEYFQFDSLDQLRERVVDLITDVGFYRDVFNFGLSKVTLRQALDRNDDIFRIQNPGAVRSEVLKGREKFRQLITQQDRELIEFFHRDHYMDHCSILENLIFTSPEPVTSDKALYEQLLDLMEKLDPDGSFTRRVEEIGIKIIKEVADLVIRMGLDRHQLESNPAIPRGAMSVDLQSWSDKLRNPERLTSKDHRRLVKIGMDYIAAQGIDLYIDDDFRKRTVALRHRLMEEEPLDMKQPFPFYHQDNYVDGGTIRQNIIMGKVNTTLYDADSRINHVLDQVIREIQLEDEIISLGLLMDVGERGSRLSGGQAQKAAICRVFLKNPRILILDEATSALDNHSQKTVSGAIEKQFADSTVITIAHRLDTIRDYDLICVLAGGSLEESGSFQQLVSRGGLFARLWESAGGKTGEGEQK